MDDRTIIYDSQCWLCNKAVKFLDSGKTASQFKFLPASDPKTNSLIEFHNLQPNIKDHTVIFIDKNRAYTKSTAIIKALQLKGGIYRLAAIFYIVPGFIRNRIYDFIARMRHRRN